jgi:hypothetical protein
LQISNFIDKTDGYRRARRSGDLFVQEVHLKLFQKIYLADMIVCLSNPSGPSAKALVLGLNGKFHRKERI